MTPFEALIASDAKDEHFLASVDGRIGALKANILFWRTDLDEDAGKTTTAVSVAAHSGDEKEFRPMPNKIVSILVCGVLGSIFSFGVEAMPVSSAPAHAVTTHVTPVRGFCGLGFHRGPYGYCLRNGTPYGYVPAFPPPPPPVGMPFVCPFGFYVGPYGRCYAY